MPRSEATGHFLASHWRTRPFLSPLSPAPPPGPARCPSAAGVDGSRRMLMRGRPPHPIGSPRSVGEVSAESQKNRAGPTAACSASGAGRALHARPPGDPQGKPSPAARPPALTRSAAPAPGACASPAPAGGAFVPRSAEARLKGQLLEGLGDPSSPRASPRSHRETSTPPPPWPNPLSCHSFKESSPGCGVSGRFKGFLVGRGYVRSRPR